MKKNRPIRVLKYKKGTDCINGMVPLDSDRHLRRRTWILEKDELAHKLDCAVVYLRKIGRQDLLPALRRKAKALGVEHMMVYVITEGLNSK